MSDHNDSVESMDDVDLLCDEMENLTEMLDIEDVPSALIIANIDNSVFEDPAAQTTFENIFKEIDKGVTFIYLKNFRRARLQFISSELASIARLRYDGVSVCGQSIRCYFIQHVRLQNSDSNHLQPPAPQRMFLISPPASPPVGWEPVPEAEPIINYDLLHAIARLNPGDVHEVHASTVEAPAIVVHLCEDPEGYEPGKMRQKITQTKRPDGTS
ncbi:calcipressin-1-like isoform X1 [Biomphalaria glabrata]|uniref:Calcipressin-1-like isoform X1 n=3 Tax=Biomphalaria TaxID=6525 RepID=A0A2C9LXH1_BIOGL|nr:calcipressin-1-like isoform X1 [Biomphalaria glabrata]KAI8757808.1 calcipressin-1-like isoform X1 [Biomphalaria glabrata]KAI8773089.1 calcipressin-1 isoform X1 [Biomphalaria glabrata]KAK0047417.1 calcipressin-1-like isoform X1 [Biomphalaria pfeifferi]